MTTVWQYIEWWGECVLRIFDNFTDEEERKSTTEWQVSLNCVIYYKNMINHII